MIDIQNVKIIKYGQKLFHDFSWTIREDEHWVISGANGSGKTLLLELLAGKVQLAQGRVRYNFILDHDWDSYYEALRSHIQYIPAHAAHSLLKKHHGLFYQQRYYGSFNESIPLVKEIFEQGLEQLHELEIPLSFNIASLLDLPLTRLSNGQFKKVLILKHLLAGQTKLLLLDYPFEGLDSRSRADLSDFIDHIANQKGIQVILSDHYHHLPQVINRRLTLNNFRIQQQRTIQPSKVSVADKPQKRVNHDDVADSKSIVEMKNLRIQYGQKVILENFHWMIRQGERWALTGANGSGKTTLFSLIYADHPLAYSQEIYLFGKRRGTGESIWDIKKRVNYLGPELISFLNPRGISDTGFDYIKNRQKLNDEASLQELIVYLQAEAFMRKPLSQLSSGELQILLLIQCFLEEKELLLLDEPFQFLDDQQKERVSVYMQKYLDKDKTLIMITHYEDDITRWSEYVMNI
ncbi:ATP-binding cassette domain-containing protein [Catalinimonas niigatensis]|uniref:ATP-binding cassette domain-containing protein n=1 Tax=Catalinimonas niigatensis TaxID=1397264 RepID=UPI0026667157|nr:ATP-binding cassette domain-containing protein [Catalinimonas niigatensis]WPP51747.1 ATP-binding cassette domain-containing protein [Catalinimonas niigatensis]